MANRERRNLCTHAHLVQLLMNESSLQYCTECFLTAGRQANNLCQAAEQASLRLRAFVEGTVDYGILMSKQTRCIIEFCGLLAYIISPDLFTQQAASDQ